MPVAVQGDWAAFANPPRCYAIARPEPDGRARGIAAASLLHRGVGEPMQLHIRLVRPRAGGAVALLDVDGSRFALVGRGVDLWAPNRATDLAIVAAMRGGRAMRVTTRGVDGRAIRHRFLLDGAATALDAATIACARGRPAGS